MGEALKNGIFIWQEKCHYVLPLQSPVFCKCLSLDLGYMGSFSLSTWLTCCHLGDPLQGLSVMVFTGSLTEEGRPTLSLGGTITIPEVLERMNRRTELSPTQYAPRSAPWLQAPCGQLPCPLSSTGQPFLSSRVSAVMDGDFKISPVSPQPPLSGTSHSDKKKMPSTGSSDTATSEAFGKKEGTKSTLT